MTHLPKGTKPDHTRKRQQSSRLPGASQPASEVDKLFQNRKHLRTDSVSTAHMHMETLTKNREKNLIKLGLLDIHAKGYARDGKYQLAGLVSMEDYYTEKAVTCWGLNRRIIPNGTYGGVRGRKAK